MALQTLAMMMVGGTNIPNKAVDACLDTLYWLRSKFIVQRVEQFFSEICCVLWVSNHQ